MNNTLNITAISSTLLPNGPLDGLIFTIPLAAFSIIPSPTSVYLPIPGFNPYIPQKAAGILILPPISEPMPITLQRDAYKAASPPDEPPTALFLFHGFNDLP